MAKNLKCIREKPNGQMTQKVILGEEEERPTILSKSLP